MKENHNHHQSNGAWQRHRKKVYVAPAHDGKGKGVFAARPIHAGEKVLVFRGPLMERSQITTQEDLEHSLLIEPGLYMGPSGGEDDYINHSCDPTTALVGRQTLIASRNIAEDEEITVDYDTLWLEPGWSMKCACGSSNCRGLVGAS
ncbi:SET domain-containing protein [Candidatus Acetothermia bacterium]|nr:SET domain-containing protein [Candidatus Acetothermia bacterium]MBI3643244.1 SET domain-containing protein [Candidatus Acetothermia bacterium]